LKHKPEANCVSIPWKHWEALVCILEKLVDKDRVENLALGELANARMELMLIN
jgi:hypothetical protein